MGIPITIVSGFLGAGKTTLINQALATSIIPKEEIIIIENEFGEVGIDHELLLHAKERIVQLNNGCMCCSLRGDLITSLTAVLEVYKVENIPLSHIILETTGIADPQPIIQTVLTAPQLNDIFYLDSILTVVDGHHLQQCLNEVEGMKQISMADRIFLSLKEEGDDEHISVIKETLAAINPLADQISFSPTKTISTKDFFSLEKFHQPLIFDSTDQEEHHHHHGLSHEFQSILLTTDQAISESLFTRWIDWLLLSNQECLFRFKGIIALQEYDLGIAMQGVNQQVDFCFTSTDAETTSIVLIGKSLDAESIQFAFEKMISHSKKVNSN